VAAPEEGQEAAAHQKIVTEGEDSSGRRMMRGKNSLHNTYGMNMEYVYGMNMSMG
jgi:hypothetical protein